MKKVSTFPTATRFLSTSSKVRGWALPQVQLLFHAFSLHAAMASFSWTFIHIELMVLGFDAVRRHSSLRYAVVVGIHLVASFAVRVCVCVCVCVCVFACVGPSHLLPCFQSLLNEVNEGCVFLIPGNVVLAMALGVWTYMVLNSPDFALRVPGRGAATASG